MSDKNKTTTEEEVTSSETASLENVEAPVTSEASAETSDTNAENDVLVEDDTPEDEDDELRTNLLLEAESLDIPVSEDDTVNTLRDKITLFRRIAKQAKDEQIPREDITKPDEKADPELAKDPKKWKDAMIRNAQQLHRVRITCNDPKLQNRSSHQINVGNSFISINKMIPMEVPVHVPSMLLRDMRRRKYVSFVKKTVRGQQVAEAKERPTYNIEQMEPLTKEQRERIAIKQRANAAVQLDE